MWDFGFMLVRYAAWQNAASREVFYHYKFDTRDFGTVGKVLDALCDTKVPKKPIVPWRAFLGACQLVARKTEQETGKPTHGFDFAGPSSETFNCLLLEMWMSEIQFELGLTYGNEWPKDEDLDDLQAALCFLATPVYDPTTKDPSLNLKKLLAPRKRNRVGTLDSVKEDCLDLKKSWRSDHVDEYVPEKRAAYIAERIGLGTFALYKVWLLLLEGLDLESFFEDKESFYMRPAKTASEAAVASRHWYKTACHYSIQLRHEPALPALPMPTRMPGMYSSRGDWFLASPASSRSSFSPDMPLTSSAAEGQT